MWIVLQVLIDVAVACALVVLVTAKVSGRTFSAQARVISEVIGGWLSTLWHKIV